LKKLAVIEYLENQKQSNNIFVWNTEMDGNECLLILYSLYQLYDRD